MRTITTTMVVIITTQTECWSHIKPTPRLTYITFLTEYPGCQSRVEAASGRWRWKRKTGGAGLSGGCRYRQATGMLPSSGARYRAIDSSTLPRSLHPLSFSLSTCLYNRRNLARRCAFVSVCLEGGGTVWMGGLVAFNIFVYIYNKTMTMHEIFYTT